MELNFYFKALRVRKNIILLSLLMSLILVNLFTFLQTFKYRSDAQIILVQRNATQNTDPYLASKSTERLGNVLSKVVESKSFMVSTLKDSPDIDKSYFGTDNLEQVETWTDTVKAKNVEDTGIMALSVYHPDRYQAELIAKAVISTLKKTHQDYHGYGNTVEIREIDQPLTTTWYASPNIIVNESLAIILGLFLGALIVYLFPIPSIKMNPVVVAQPRPAQAQPIPAQPIRPGQPQDNAPAFQQSNKQGNINNVFGQGTSGR